MVRFMLNFSCERHVLFDRSSRANHGNEKQIYKVSISIISPFGWINIYQRI